MATRPRPRPRPRPVLRIALLAVALVAVVVVLAVRSHEQPSAGLRLSWPPPPLRNATTIRLGTGETVTRLDPARDYRIELPGRLKVGATTILGGHNVVILGGHITIPSSVPPGPAYDRSRESIYINGATGTVHIEGVLIDGSGGADSDGIDIAAPQAVVQIENVRIVGLTGREEGFHSDVVQPWGGVRELRIDRLTGSGNLQGLQIDRDLGPIDSATIEHADLSHTSAPTSAVGNLLWLTTGATTCNAYPVTLRDVYVHPRPGRPLGRTVWPNAGGPLACAGVVHGSTVTWPHLPVSGKVEGGRPPGGEFVPAGVAGVDYRSPGYKSSP